MARRKNGRNGRNQNSGPPRQQENYPMGYATEHAQSQWILQQTSHLTEEVGGLSRSVERIERDVEDIEGRIRKIHVTIVLATGVIIGTVGVLAFLGSSKLSELMMLIEAASKVSGAG